MREFLGRRFGASPPLGCFDRLVDSRNYSVHPWDKISKDELMEDLRSASSSQSSGEGALGAVT